MRTSRPPEPPHHPRRRARETKEEVMNYQIDARFQVHAESEEAARALLEEHLRNTSQQRALAFDRVLSDEDDTPPRHLKAAWGPGGE